MLLVSIVSAYATERKYDFVVAQDGSGDFTTIQEAINAVPDFRKANRTNILIKKGNYKEKLIIPNVRSNLHSQEKTVRSSLTMTMPRNPIVSARKNRPQALLHAISMHPISSRKTSLSKTAPDL